MRSQVRRIGAEVPPRRSDRIHADAKPSSSIVHTDHPVGITASSIRRIARRAGVLTISNDVYLEGTRCYDNVIGTLVHEVCINAKHARRASVSMDDVRAVLRERDLVVFK